MAEESRSLVERLKARNGRAAVIGLGYVGLPLAVEFAKAGLTVTGIDLDERKVDAVNRGESYILDVSEADVQACGEGRPPRARPPTSRCWPTSTRSTSACRRRCARPRIPTCPTSSRRSSRSPSTCKARSARHPRIDDLSRARPTRWCSRCSRPSGLEGRRRLLPGVLARARRSGQPAVPHRQHPEGRRRRQRGVHRGRGGALRAGRQGRRAGRRARASPRWSSCSRTRSAP